MSGDYWGLSTFNPALGQRQRAAAMATLMICGCIMALPLAGSQVAGSESFILISHTALALMGLVVSALLFAQFAGSRSPALLLLGCGYLSVALTTVPQLLRALSGVHDDFGLRFITDASLPFAAIACLLLLRGPGHVVDGSRMRAMLSGGIVATLVIAAISAWLAAPGDVAAMQGDAGPIWRMLTTTLLCATTGIAIALLWRRCRSALDLWLLVALIAWLIDILLRGVAQLEGSFLSHVARLYGLLGTACLLAVLLREHARLYSWFAGKSGTRATRRDAPRRRRVSLINAIANQLNQPLCAITINADSIARLLERERLEKGEIRAALADIVNEAQRASQTLQTARHLFADATEPAEVVDIGQLVDECLSQLRPEMSAQCVTCEVDTAEELPGIRGFRGQLRQMLSYLLANALDAMSGVQHQQRRLRIRARRHDARAVILSVEDSGTGIRPEIRPHIFDPFFTTKPSRFGLGLAICRSIVDTHGGHISVEAGEAGGAAFRVVLPASS